MSSIHVTLFVSSLLLVSSISSPSPEARGDKTSGADVPGKCKFSCSGGTQTPSPRTTHKRSANGCGIDSFRLPASALPHPDLEWCCNEHDLCYDTCLADKDSCDADFKACLDYVCDTKAAAATKDACRSTAYLLTSMTQNLGCESFLRSQKDACVCETGNERLPKLEL
ncbi:hypothetical protein HPB48_006790 [Haemaphysalis longicornis]|uniref:Phospholipase A2 n=1 Tax=Haemaphysalis longicornis TaxID=44386 RepID=A0A9J6FM44_HAELO|nr:hypothetical protein HPB48_006790 [Haemaphysalis longicornis]